MSGKNITEQQEGCCGTGSQAGELAAVCAFQLKQQERQLEELTKLVGEVKIELATLKPWLKSNSERGHDHETRLKALELKAAATEGRASLLAILWSSVVGMFSGLVTYYLSKGGHP
jgi:hypothetical protein